MPPLPCAVDSTGGGGRRRRRYARKRPRLC